MSEIVKLVEGYEKKKNSLRLGFVSKLEKMYKTRSYRLGAVTNAISDLEEEKETVNAELTILDNLIAGE